MDFNTRKEADAFVEIMRGIWRKVDGTVMVDPKVRIVDWVESREY